ncbi:MAG: Smr/MutS family protein [Acidobacteria bacterium]|nr:Smr/MutS family protein [Acidobacteriota bacterium]
MRQLKVKPVDKTPQLTPEAQSLSAPSDEALFLEAMASLSTEAPKSEQEPTTRVKLAKKRAFEINEILDLHGKTKDEAIHALTRFVIDAFANGVPSVIVVTGKGKHAASGQATLKPVVERWITQKGARFIKAYAEAPRAMGGAGAFVIYLRSN